MTMKTKTKAAVAHTKLRREVSPPENTTTTKMDHISCNGADRGGEFYACICEASMHCVTESEGEGL